MRYKLKEKDNIYSNDDFGRYIPAYYNEISGSANTGNLLAQIKYWWEKNGKKEFFLPIQRIAWQIGVSYKKARTAAERLVELGFIKTVSRQCGYAPKMTHWTFCEETVGKAISQYKSSRTINSIKKISNSMTENTNDSAGSSIRPTGRTVCPQGQTDRLPGRTYINTNSNTNFSSFREGSPLQEGSALDAREREKEDFQNIYYATGTPVPNPNPPEKPNGIIPIDLKSITEPMIEIWNGLCPVAKAEAKDFMFGLHSRFLDSFNSSLDEWEQYCRKIASSKFLMGERPMSNGKFYKLALTWALSLKNIADVKNGKYDTDRIIPQTQQEIIAEKESIIDRINNSHEDSWVINLRKALLNKLGDSVYKSWLSDLKIQEKEDKIFLVASSSFRADHIEQHYCDDILAALKAQGIKKTIYFYDQHGLPNTNAIPSRSAINSNETQSTIAISLQSLANGLRSKNSLRKPMPIEEPCELVGKYDYSTQPSIRNALIKASEKFANRA